MALNKIKYPRNLNTNLRLPAILQLVENSKDFLLVFYQNSRHTSIGKSTSYIEPAISIPSTLASNFGPMLKTAESPDKLFQSTIKTPADHF